MTEGSSSQPIVCAGREGCHQHPLGCPDPRPIVCHDCGGDCASPVCEAALERAHIVVSPTPPATEAGRLWHDEWHSGDYFGAPRECGTMGCGFLGRILAVEAEVRDDLPDHDPATCLICRL